MANLHILFAEMDTDGDGMLTVEELRVGAKRLGLNMAEPDLEELFVQMDGNKSGEVDYAEFVDNYPAFAQKRLRHTFEKLDIDGSGTLSLEEMRGGLDELGIDEQDLEPLFRKLDDDGSGAVDYAEFANKLLLELAGGWVGGALKPPGQGEHERFAWLTDTNALQVYVVSLEGLPRRPDSNAGKPEVFAVRVRWPSAPFFGQAELKGLQAYIWGAEGRPPAGSHGAYVYVDKTARLPWVGGQGTAVLSVSETDLLRERLVGEVLLKTRLGHEKRVRRFPIVGPEGTLEGYAHVAVICPSSDRRSAHRLYKAPERYPDALGRPRTKPPLHLRRPMPSPSSAPWWSPFGLCSSAELRMAESC